MITGLQPVALHDAGHCAFNSTAYAEKYDQIMKMNLRLCVMSYPLTVIRIQENSSLNGSWLQAASGSSGSEEPKE